MFIEHNNVYYCTIIVKEKTSTSCICNYDNNNKLYIKNERDLKINNAGLCIFPLIFRVFFKNLMINMSNKNSKKLMLLWIPVYKFFGFFVFI